MSRTLSAKAGSPEGLKVAERCGRNPKAFRIRPITVCGRPPYPVIGRVAQWAAAGRIQSHDHVTDDPGTRNPLPPFPISAADVCSGRMVRILHPSGEFPAGRPACANSLRHRDVAGAGNASTPTRGVPETTVTHPNARIPPGTGIDAGSAWPMVAPVQERWPSG